ncbi:MAG: PKD domain-containing protein [Mucilaginibacter sp.]
MEKTKRTKTLNHKHNFRLFIILLHFIAGWGPPADAQSTSNLGSEFWAVFPTHVPDFDQHFQVSLANMSIFITGPHASSGRITAGTFSQAFTVSPNTITEIQIPRANAYVNDFESGTVLPGRAVHILVDSGRSPVVVYAHIFAGQRSAASLILPKNALGQQYYSVNYPEYDHEGKNFIAIVASEAATTVHLKKNGQDLVPGGITLPHRDDVYEYLSDEDLTGVSVSVDSARSACKRFAMFSGSSAVYITADACEPGSIDPLFQQAYPVDSWGQTYGFIPFAMQSPNFKMPVRTAGQYARVLAKDSGTIVRVNGVQVAVLNPGQFYNSPEPIHEPAFISASKAVCVAQYALTQSCSDANRMIKDTLSGFSDPDMVILNPISYNIKNITVYSSKKENITEQYINILLKTTATESFKVNGVAPSLPFVPMTSLPGYAYLQLNLNNYPTQTFTLTADDGFNALAYGFGNVESYAYSAGTNLSSSYGITAVNTATQLPTDSSCVDEDDVFKLTLPYRSPAISWKMDAGEPATIQLNPAPIVLVQNDQTAYVYSFPKTTAYRRPGKHLIKITAAYPTTLGGCATGTQEIPYSFFVIPPPRVRIGAVPETCDNVIDFHDLSTDTAGIVARMWDFGDTTSRSARTDTAKNPVHVFADSGTYYVRLSITSATGCRSDLLDTIRIARKINLAFSVSAPACAGEAIFFRDESRMNHFKATIWKWYFGNGDSLISRTADPAVYRYPSPGVYPVKLILVNAQGCASDTLTRLVTIHARPIPDFDLPGICVTDQSAVFTDRTQFPGGGQGQQHYFWTFGDANASAGNPDTSTAQNPVHRFTTAREYLISERVTSADGCDTMVTKSFFVNGATPKAAFQILNQGRSCRNEPVLVKSRSTVDFGRITRLEWYFDALNRPLDKVVVTGLATDSTYYYRYPSIRTNTDSVSYTIKLLAYSGTSCVDSASSRICLWSVPVVHMDTLKTVCQDSGPVRITQGGETTGISGYGAYTGRGITAAGWFDPALAGSGTHRITYTFTSPGGCSDSVSGMIVVIRPPAVTLPEKIDVIQGQAVTIKPLYSGDITAYEWTPSTLLDNRAIPWPTLTPTRDLDYTITVSNDYCTAAAVVRVHVLKPPIIYNTFTPNGDGINDVWNIKNLDEYPKATVEILNRYGTLIFRSIGYSKPWDGTYRGSGVPAGTYYYIIDLKNGEKLLSGFIFVAR